MDAGRAPRAHPPARPPVGRGRPDLDREDRKVHRGECGGWHYRASGGDRPCRTCMNLAVPPEPLPTDTIEDIEARWAILEGLVP